MSEMFWNIVVLISVMLLCSCAAKTPTIHEDRKHCTGIEANERVVIVLNTFKSHDKSIESEGEEKSLANCVRDGMMKVDSRLRSISAKEFRDAIFPNKGFFDSPRSSEDLLSSLSNPDAQSRLLKLGVRYLVILTATTDKSEGEWRTDVDSDKQSLMVMVGKTWVKSSSRGADVLDVKYLRQSGSVNASCSGERGWGFCGGCLVGGPTLCLPVPPIPFFYAEPTETQACSALGEAVMKFLIDGHDMMRTPELGTGIDSEGRGSDIQSDIQTSPQPESEDDLREMRQKPEGKDGQN